MYTERIYGINALKQSTNEEITGHAATPSPVPVSNISLESVLSYPSICCMRLTVAFPFAC